MHITAAALVCGSQLAPSLLRTDALQLPLHLLLRLLRLLWLLRLLLLFLPHIQHPLRFLLARLHYHTEWRYRHEISALMQVPASAALSSLPSQAAAPCRHSFTSRCLHANLQLQALR